MASTPIRDLTILRTGFGHLVRRPWTVLGLALLSMALAALGPFLQLRFGLPDRELAEGSLSVADLLSVTALLPLELYFIPRFLQELDAKLLDPPRNPAQGWQAAFEERWFRAFLAKIALAVAVGLGFQLLVFPGVFILGAFGWAPLRVLLRGETLVEAARGSYRLMAKAWPRAVLAALGVLLVALVLLTVLGTAQNALLPHPTPWLRLTRPSVWCFNFLSAFVSLWVSTSFLALYHRLEAEALPPPLDPAP